MMLYEWHLFLSTPLKAKSTPNGVLFAFGRTCATTTATATTATATATATAVVYVEVASANRTR